MNAEQIARETLTEFIRVLLGFETGNDMVANDIIYELANAGLAIVTKDDKAEIDAIHQIRKLVKGMDDA